MLVTPSDTAFLRLGDAECFAYFQPGRAGLEVTVLLTEADGQTLRSRIDLADGQQYAIRVGGDDLAVGTSVTFRRVGAVIEIVGTAEPPMDLSASN